MYVYKIRNNQTIAMLGLLWLSLLPQMVLASTSTAKPTKVSSQYQSIMSAKLAFLDQHIKQHSKISLQLGGFIATENHDQHININGLFGNDFSGSNDNSSNGLVGAAFFVEGQDTKYASFLYGVNAFYLPRVVVNGTITQEQIFTNLAYQYATTNWPIYFGIKANLKKPQHDKCNLTLDVGIGPNIIETSQYNETSISSSSQPNFSFTASPDNAFSGKTSVAFAAQAGVGLRFNPTVLEPKAQLECGYRFFYLGQGGFYNHNNQYLDTLNTGHAYANALLCALTV